jgi:ParB-like chromosome segregation protein Spo0J
MQVEIVALSSLVADPANVRLHPEKNLEAIKGSLKKFGQQKPIVVDKDGIVVAGNGTLAAARALGWETVAVVRTGLEGVDKVAFAIADNRTGELAEWSDPALVGVLDSLKAVEFDVSAIGFSDADIAALTCETAGGDSPEKYAVTVTLDDAAAQQDLFLELRDRGFRVKT